MSTIAIQVENLSKQYKIGLAQQRHDTLRDQLTAGFKSLFHLNGHRSALGAQRSAPSDTFWALKDISFEVKEGEVVGIIGRNGSGKSTLLKILSRITEPTEGRARIQGRVASLLEVGTGFHPELTGRENIYLNGAILGMKKAEIDRNFDEIVAFSEIEKFIDTPVKRYSTGMYVRLAFAVAAHLEPEILIVDEVLAVGDTAFQKKCLGKMGDVAKGGKTVLFVSHNIAAIQSLCSRCLVLDGGVQKFNGDVKEAISLYVQQFNGAASSCYDLSLRSDRSGEGGARFTSLSFEDITGTEVSSIPIGSPLRICLKFESKHQVRRPQINITFNTSLGQRLFRLFTLDQAVRLPDLNSNGTVICEIPSIPLLPARYYLSISVTDGSGNLQDEINTAAFLEVVTADIFGTGCLPCGSGDLIFVPSRWTAQYKNHKDSYHDLAEAGTKGA